MAALDQLEDQVNDGQSEDAQFGPNERRTRATLAATSGALDAFVAAIVEFNETSEDPRSVAKLNAAYREQERDNFGLDPADYEQGGPCEDRSYEDDLDAARTRAGDALYDEYRRLSHKLSFAAKKTGLG